jgi:enterochelin esterase family protein
MRLRASGLIFPAVLLFSGSLFSQTFSDFTASLLREPDSLARSRAAGEYLRSHRVPVIEDTVVHFIYHGAGKSVAAPGEFNGWNPSSGRLNRIEGTNLWVRDEHLPSDARVEYKIWVDSLWMIDALNPGRARGPFGENSEIRMPGYQVSTMDILQEDIPEGRLDTFWIASKALQLKHPVVIYTPASVYTSGISRFPLVIVTDGLDYLNFARMHTILNNLIGLRRIRPVIAAFIDPKTALHDGSTNKRMTEYAASDAYLDFLEKEAVPEIAKKYPVADSAGGRLVVGASMGGLIATYAVLTRPDFFGNSGAQSPSYLQADSAVIKIAGSLQKAPGRFLMQTGTIGDTQAEARYVADRLVDTHAAVSYEEIHEGHNWTNWKRNLPKLLEFFFK